MSYSLSVDLLSELSDAKGSNILIYGATALPKSKTVKAEALMQLREMTSDARIELVIQEVESGKKQTFTQGATNAIAMFSQNIPAKTGLTYNLVFTFIAGADEVKREYTVITSGRPIANEVDKGELSDNSPQAKTQRNVG